ncbi:hypothetical protein [Streptomyces sp. FL07-04A]|uniref:hypothetical protein n=1 Tax=Streptomyces sp. FL07-04A TaxID=3028658 RepID=UPI0029AD5560|nr:hypothetical protein [Streptomyces sp. FL07-04A]MDX3575508.1 hypothetical protein [Streptomyces sp. FL07-04A]
MFAAAASVGLATLAAALSLSIFVNRGKKITPSNLTAVKKWYAKELSKGKRAALGGVLLIAAIVTAGGTAVAGLLMSAEKQDMRAQIGVTSSQKGGTPNVHVSVRVLDMSKESAMVVNLKGHSGQSWLNATIQPAADGIAVLEQDIETAISKAPLTLSVKAMDGSRVLKTFRTVNINGTARPSTDPTEDCRVAKPECPDSFHSWRICKKD